MFRRIGFPLVAPQVIPRSAMEVQEEIVEGIVVLRLDGEIDLHVSPVLRETLQSKSSEKCPALLFDFSKVRYIDSSGLATLIEYCRDIADYNGRMALCSLAPKVKMVFDLVRLNELFTIADTQEAALAALATP